MLTLNKDTKILLDCDVIRHFIKGDKLSLLNELYKGHLVLLDVVHKELIRSRHLQIIIEGFLKWNNIEIKKFSDNIEIMREFAKLKKRYGDGESACMAVARYEKNIIASSNLKDIKKYCHENNIKYITTMDILLDAFQKSKLSKAECNKIITTVREKNSKLPVNSIEEYIDLVNLIPQNFKERSLVKNGNFFIEFYGGCIPGQDLLKNIMFSDN